MLQYTVHNETSIDLMLDALDGPVTVPAGTSVYVGAIVGPIVQESILFGALLPTGALYIMHNTQILTNQADIYLKQAVHPYWNSPASGEGVTGPAWPTLKYPKGLQGITNDFGFSATANTITSGPIYNIPFKTLGAYSMSATFGTQSFFLDSLPDTTAQGIATGGVPTLEDSKPKDSGFVPLNLKFSQNYQVLTDEYLHARLLEDESNISDTSLCDRNLQGLPLNCVEFDHVLLTGSSLANCSTEAVEFNAVFMGLVDLTEAESEYCSFYDCSFLEATMRLWKGKSLTFHRCDFAGADLFGARLQSCMFNNCDLSRVKSLKSADFQKSTFMNCLLPTDTSCYNGSNWNGVILEDTPIPDGILPAPKAALHE